ncbi:hypothetical protein M422DRAFT_147037, partial [Sphaerobolus stellatus SS14]
SWLWGSEWEMYNSAPGQKYLEWYKSFGRIVKFKSVIRVSALFFNVNRILIYASSHCYDFPKPDGELQFFLTLLGKGMIWAEGEAHQCQRRILGSAFSLAALRDLSPIFF